MYGIYTYIYHKKQPNVGKYTIHGSYGNVFALLDFVLFFFRSVPSLKLTYPLKMDGWFRRSGFFLGFGLFLGAFAGSFREGT